MAKYCANCNKLLTDDQIKFCPDCGCPQFIPAVPVQPAAPAQPVQPVAPVAPVAPVTPTAPVAPAAPAHQQSAPVMPQLDTIPAAKPKRKFGFKKIAFIAIPIILVAAILINMSSIIGLATKLFGSDESYFAYVEKQSVTDTADTFSEFYQNYLLDDALRDNNYNVKFSVKLGDDLKEAIKGGYGDKLDINWMDDTEFDMTVNTSGKKVSDDLLIAIGGQHVLTTSAVFDLDSNKMLLKLKEITDDVLVFDLTNSTKKSGNYLSSLTGENKELAAAVLPKSSVAKDLLTKYHGIVIDKIDNVTKTKENITVGDITEELTVLKAEISQKTIKEISLAVLGELKEDSQIKAIIENAESELKKNGITDESGSAYENFKSKIDEAISEITAEEASDEMVSVIYDYVNSDDEIVGRKIGENGEALDYVKVKSGNKFASRCNLEGSAEYTGTGTENGDLETSEYTFKENGEVLYKIALTDFDKEAFKKGKIDGKIRLFPNSEAIKAASPSKYKSFASMLDAAIEIDGKGDSKKGKFKLTAYNGEKPLFTADADYSISAAKSVSDPSGKQVQINGLNSLQTLLKDLHLDQFVANLRKTTVPKEYVDAIEEASKELKQ